MTRLPESLRDFEMELTAAATRDVKRSARRRRTLWRAGAVAATGVVVFTVLSVVNVFGAGGPSIVGKALAALAGKAEAIVHVVMVGTQDNGDGTTMEWRWESWETASEPNALRSIQTAPDGTVVESVLLDDRIQLYSAAEGVIYDVPNTAGTWDKRVFEDFRRAATHFLESGRAHVTGEVVINGRKATEIASDDGREVYVVDAATSTPLEWRTTGDSGGTLVRFPVFEEMPATQQNMRVFDLTVLYPDIPVDHDLDHYEEFQKNGRPND